MRLDKFLSDSGIGTRSEIKKIIKSGAVKVGDTIASKPEMKIDELSDTVIVNGEKICYKKFIYLMMNKPKDYVSATWDKHLPVVLDLVSEEYLHFEPFPVGRLDIDTEGLLVLTNDGQLSHNLLSPKKHIPKKYYAETDCEIENSVIDEFLKGVTLDDGYKTKPGTLEMIGDKPTNKAFITITEGKFHQVKRMFESVGKRVTYLKRVQMNELKLDESLKSGESRELTNDELSALKNY